MSVVMPASGQVLVTVTARITPGGGDTGYMSFASSGGSGANVAASDTRALVREHGTSNNTGYVQASATYLVTGLGGGTKTFAAQYRQDGGTASFANRNIIVIPLP